MKEWWNRPNTWYALIVLAVWLLCLVLAKGLENHTRLALVAAACPILLVVWFFHRSVTVHAALAFSCFSLPIGVPFSVHPLDLDIDLWDPLVAASALYVYFTMRPPKLVNRSVIALLTAWALATAIGWHNGNSTFYWFNESRVQLVLIGALYVAAGIAFAGKLHEYRWTALFVLWGSALLLLSNSVTGSPELIGRRSAASLNGAATDVARLLTNTQFAALAALCVCVALVVSGTARWSQLWPFMIPAIAIVFLAYSRNTLIAVGVTFVVALLASRKLVWPVVVTLAVAAGIYLVGAFALWATRDTTSGDFLQAQIDAYRARVIGGVGDETLARDSSTLDRLAEDRNLDIAISQAPIFGHGYGYAYQPARAGSPFTLTQGRYYAHNFYLWWTVKAGLIGLIVFGIAILVPLVRSMLAKFSYASAFTAAAVALAAVSWVAPLPIESPNTLIFGAVVGIALGAFVRNGGAYSKRAPVDDVQFSSSTA